MLRSGHWRSLAGSDHERSRVGTFPTRESQALSQYLRLQTPTEGFKTSWKKKQAGCGRGWGGSCTGGPARGSSATAKVKKSGPNLSVCGYQGRSYGAEDNISRRTLELSPERPLMSSGLTCGSGSMALIDGPRAARRPTAYFTASGSHLVVIGRRWD